MKKYIVTIALAIGAVGCQSANTDGPSPEPSSELSTRTPASPWASDLEEYPNGTLAAELDETESALIGTHNWRTGEPTTDFEVRRLKRLTEAVGENLSLTPLDAQSREDRDAYFSKTDELGRSIDAGDATSADVDNYYNRKIDYYDDRIAVLRFIISEPGWDDETIQRYSRYLAVARKERERFESQRDIRIARLSTTNQGAEQ